MVHVGFDDPPKLAKTAANARVRPPEASRDAAVPEDGLETELADRDEQQESEHRTSRSSTFFWPDSHAALDDFSHRSDILQGVAGTTLHALQLETP